MFSPSTVNELRAEKQRLEEALRALNTILELADTADKPTTRRERHESPSRISVVDRMQPPTGESVRDAIYEVLSAGGPMHRRAIHDLLVERGIRVRGQNPINSVGAHLSLDPRFESNGMGTWALVELPTEQSEHDRIHTGSIDGSDLYSDDTSDSELNDEEESVPW